MLSESKKRFKLSPEEFAVERARGIHEAVHELQRSHPEILGMTLFGSLTKGLSRPDSDVDGFIYVDLQRVAEAERETEDALVEAEESLGPRTAWGGQHVVTETYFRPDIEDSYIDLVLSVLRKNLPDMSEDQLEHIWVLPLSERIIERFVEEQVAEWRSRLKFVEASEQYRAENPIGTVEEISKEYPLPERLLGIAQGMRGMFHLELGRGIRRYRQVLIEELSKAGEIGEVVWKKVIGSTAAFEQDTRQEGLGERVAGLRYPPTLEEARKMYG